MIVDYKLMKRDSDLQRWIKVGYRAFRNLPVPKDTWFSSPQLPLKGNSQGFLHFWKESLKNVV